MQVSVGPIKRKRGLEIQDKEPSTPQKQTSTTKKPAGNPNKKQKTGLNYLIVEMVELEKKMMRVMTEA